MTDGDGSQARAYHELSKLWPGDAAPRSVDAALVPKQYKRYAGLPSIALPAPSKMQPSDTPLTLPDLAALLHYSNGIVRRSRIKGRELEFRAASCTGAAYHIETYVVCGGIEGLNAGVYHYDARAETLRTLRSGDFRGALADVTCMSPRECAIVLTSTFWRNAWRYQERTYRHVFWDTGTIAANLLALAECAWARSGARYGLRRCGRKRAARRRPGERDVGLRCLARRAIGRCVDARCAADRPPNGAAVARRDRVPGDRAHARGVEP